MNGQRVWSVYRVADAAFLVAAVTLHHLTGAGDFAALMGQGPWPEGQAALTSSEALFVGLTPSGPRLGAGRWSLENPK
jgi:NAD(P)H-quinone oxidoreductase subunit 5